jgi:hypothetical protein
VKLSHTARSGLTLAKIEPYRAPSFWQHRDIDGRQVGPHYPTKAEALADTARYALDAGWIKQETTA